MPQPPRALFAPSRLVQLRTRRGLSRSDLHEALLLLGVRRCRALIDHWERARSEPRASELFAISCILEAPMADFFEPTPDPLAPQA